MYITDVFPDAKAIEFRHIRPGDIIARNRNGAIITSKVSHQTNFYGPGKWLSTDPETFAAIRGKVHYLVHRPATKEPEPTDVEGLEASIWRSDHDGVLVVQIDTNTLPPGTRLRVNVNDSPIWDADPEQHEHTACNCVTVPDPLAALNSIHDALTAGIYGQEGCTVALIQARETIDNLIALQENSNG